MRTSDWSSDVCSSDLLVGIAPEAMPEVVLYDAADPTTRALFGVLAQRAATNEPLAGAVPCMGEAMAPCMLVYTSCTTGKPKAVLLRQTDLIFRSTIQGRPFKTTNYTAIKNFHTLNQIP